MLQEAAFLSALVDMAEDLFVHIFARMQDGESIYLCGARSEAVAASVGLEWAHDFLNNLMCPECLRQYSMQSDDPATAKGDEV